LLTGIADRAGITKLVADAVIFNLICHPPNAK
jgi:hypothetical protein